MMFKSKKKEDFSSLKNPYDNAKYRFNTINEEARISGRIGVIFGLICLLILLTSVCGWIYIAGQSKFIPLVFRQDAMGNTISMTRGDRVPDAVLGDYRAVVADFISNIRLVTPDVELQKKAIYKTYGYLTNSGAAVQKVSEFYRGGPNNPTPFKRAEDEIVSVEIKSIIEQSLTTWQADWIEVVRSRDGKIKQEIPMRVFVTLMQDPNAKIEDRQLISNPHLIFITDFNWSKQL